MSRLDDPTVGVDDPTVSADSGAGASIRPSLPIGTYIGRYITTGKLGRGGMGVVYAAHDPTLDRPIAVKLLHSTHADSAERLIREARAQAMLADPHVVAVYDAGEYGEGQVYIAMQLVDGEDLATILDNKRPSPSDIERWFIHAGRGLAAAHAAGLVHRDFKPSNVIIDRTTNTAMVTDFGLARPIVADGAARPTTVGILTGTPAYMSPEQHGQQPATQASDQFSFCVAMWEALFGQHPYIAGARDTLTPVAIGFAIYDAPLIAPPRTADKRIVAALARGLEREPERRWPAMTDLLAALAPPPPPRRSRWPVIAAAGFAGAAVATATVLALRPRAETNPTSSCVATAQDRARVAWSVDASGKLAAAFAKTGRPYAATAARDATAALDRFAQRWQQLAADACLAAQTAPAADELASRKRTCLDTRLDALRSVATVLVSAPTGELVDHANAVVDGLPNLDECADTTALLAGPGSPPPALAERVDQLATDLTVAVARGNGGAYEEARAELTALAKRADELGWPPAIARAHLALGLQQSKMLLPARDELLRAAELATAQHLDRDAARAYSAALLAAGFERSPDAVAALSPVARGAAARTGDRRMILQADIAVGRALVRARQYKVGTERCRAALAAARDLDGPTERDSANDCLVEGLVPQGAYAELEPLLATLIADRSTRLGADHPNITDFLGVQLGLDLRAGKLQQARTAAERVLAIRRAAYPPRHVKIAEAEHYLADVAQAQGKTDEAKRLYESALAIATDAKPEPLILLNNLHQSLAYIAAAADDRKTALAHFEQSAALTKTRTGPDSIEYAFVLLNYGQVKADDNVDAGIGLLGEAVDILERAHDKRAATAGAALAITLEKHKRFADARRLLESALAHVDADVDPVHVGEIEFALAKAITETKGDPKRARTLATSARAKLAKGGAQTKGEVADLDKWLARQR